MTLSYECKGAQDMMDKARHDTGVWHLPYHSLPTPDLGHDPYHMNPMTQNGPDWATVSTVSNRWLPVLTMVIP